MSASKLPYEAPEMKTLGTVHAMTLDLNKVGHAVDQYSGQVPIVGSITPAP
jgi:hypothetical protein